MNLLSKNISRNLLGFFMVLFLYPSQVSAIQQIKISAFWFCPSEMSKYESLPASYTMHPLQIRIEHSFDSLISMADLRFEKYGSGFLTSLPELIFPNMRVLTSNGWLKVSVKDFGCENSRDKLIKKIAYSYNPVIRGSFSVNALCADNHFSPAIYTDYKTENWYAKSLKKDSIAFYFDMDPSEFLIRLNKLPVYDDMHKIHYVVTPDSDPLDFYAFYALSYINKSKSITNRNVNIDLIYENIDDKKSTYNDSIYDVVNYSDDKMANGCMERICAVVDTLSGINIKMPENLTCIVNSQMSRMNLDTTERKIVWGFCKSDRKQSYGLVAIDHSMLYTKDLIHEILHACIDSIDKQGFETNFFAEAIIEYLASFVEMYYFGTDSVFLQHQLQLDRYDYSVRNVKRLLAIDDGNNIVDGTDGGNDTSWIYYDLLPVRLHSYCKKYNEKDFFSAVIEYMTKTAKKDISFRTFNSYMKSKGFYNVQSVWKPFC